MNPFKLAATRLGSAIKRKKEDDENHGLFDNKEFVDDRPFSDEITTDESLIDTKPENSDSLSDPVSPEISSVCAPLVDEGGMDTTSNDQNQNDEDQSIVSKPVKILVGHQAEISKKDLMTYLVAKVNESFTKEISHIGIQKSETGFYWEIHEGGPGKGMIKSILKSLESQDSIHLPSEDRVLRITKTSSGGIKALLLSEREMPELTKGIVAQEKMISLSSSGNGLLFFGLVSVSLSMIALLMAFFIKYSVINKQESVEATRNISSTPISEIQKLRETLKLDGVYVESMSLNGNGKYLIKTAIEKVIAETEDSSNLNSEKSQTESKPKELEGGNTGELQPLNDPTPLNSTTISTETPK